LTFEELLQGFTVTADVQKTSPFLHYISIRRIAGKILQIFHCTTTNTELSRQERYEIQQSLYRDLQAWRAEIPNIDGLLQKDELPTSSFRSSTWYEIPYHNALLLLYRPSPSFPHSKPTYNNTTEDILITLNNVYTSSRSVIYLYWEQHRNRRLNYSWITLHAVFIAGLSFVYCISSIIKETKRRGSTFPPSLEYTQIIDVTRTCSNVLVAINERWATARGSLDIFSHLSDAIIQDVVKAQLNVQNQPGSSSSFNPNDARLYTSRKTSHPQSRSEDTQLAPQLGKTQAHQQEDGRMPNMPNSFSGRTLSMADNDLTCASASKSFESSIAENGFRQFYNSLHGDMPETIRYPDFVPSEVVMGFSQDWFAGDDMPSTQSSSDGMCATDLWELMGLVSSTNQFE
jgi:hypothetical protein